MDSKKFAIMSVLFCVMIIAFFALGELNILSNFTVYVLVTYVSYFAGLALYFNGRNLGQTEKAISSKTCRVFGIILIVVSIIFLIYGVIIDEIPLFA